MGIVGFRGLIGGTGIQGGQLALQWLGLGNELAGAINHASLLVASPKDHVMIDVGPRYKETFQFLYIPIIVVRNIVITHMHWDHVGGLAELALYNKVAPKILPREDAQYLGRDKRLTLIAPPDLTDLLSKHVESDGFIATAADEDINFRTLFNTVPMEPVEGAPSVAYRCKTPDGLRLVFFKTKHLAVSYGVIINERVAYTSDTPYDPELITAVVEGKFTEGNKPQLLYHDCATDGGQIPGHATFEQLKELPVEIREKIVLTHYGDNYAELSAEVYEKKLFRGFASRNKEVC